MLRLRPPRPNEGPTLTELCLRSKAAHGYDAAFIAACREELTVDPGKSHMVVAEFDQLCAGVAEISIADQHAELEKLFVDPALQGKGIGRALFEWAKTEALGHGARVLALDADPGALVYYERMGGQVIGQSPSGSIPGRTLPRLELRLCGTVEA